MLNTEKATAAARAIPYPMGIKDRAEFNIQFEGYCSALNAITKRFREYLDATYGGSLTEPEKRNLWEAIAHERYITYSDMEEHYRKSTNSL